MLKARPGGAHAARFPLPWWIGLICAATIWLFCGFALPSLMSGHVALSRLLAWGAGLATWLGLLIVTLGVFVFLRRLDLRRLEQTSDAMASLRALKWPEFEIAVAQGFRELGYEVENHGWYTPTVPVHLRLRRGGQAILVECREWRAEELGVDAVRKLDRGMRDAQAHGALLVTAGTFSKQAHAFVSDKPIGLIDGAALLELVAAGRDGEPAHDEPRCPVCERPMRRKRASGGSTIGPRYWGCSAYPRCLGARPLVAGATLSTP